jgi:hypothetical protein
VVLHPARRLAPSHGVHDHSSRLVCLFSGWLHHLSCARGREIFRIHRLDRGGLLSDPGLARSAGVCDAAVGRFDACSGFSAPMGPAQADRALDDPNLVVRVGYWRSSLLNALPMVPSTGSLSAAESAVLSGLPRYSQFRRCSGHAHATAMNGKSLRCQNLALNGDLMFDQGDVLPRMKENLW